MQVGLNLFGKVVDIHHHPLEAGTVQLGQQQAQQGLAPHRHQGFGHRIGQGTQTGTQARCKNHCLLHE